MALRVREHGPSDGPVVVVLHGGPGAPGSASGLARGLADPFRVLEPFQRDDGPEPLTVALHVADLRDLVGGLGAGTRPAVVGHSWGAMLALAFAAAHPDLAGPLALVGCGTFDPASRSLFRRNLDALAPPDLPRRLAQADALPDADSRLAARAAAFDAAYFADPLSTDTGAVQVSERANRETWSDMLRLQADGTYPAAFRAIRSPVLMLHGARDPHPGTSIRDSLAPFLPGLEYREFGRCGHYPWLERHAREEFFAALRSWLARRRPGGRGGE